MIAEFIKNYGVLGAQGVGVILGAWIVWFLVKNVVKLMWAGYHRFINKLDIQLEQIHLTGQKNVELNKKSVMIQDKTANNLATMTQVIRNTLEMSNGGNPVVKKILERLDKIEEKT